MSEHKREHGRSAMHERQRSGRDATEQEGMQPDPVLASEDAREISRILDEEEGYDRKEPPSVQKQNRE